MTAGPDDTAPPEDRRDDATAALAHELRTPLTAIRALAELMLDTPDMTGDERAGFLRIIVAESSRLGRLVNDMLDLAKLGSGHAGLITGDVDLARLAADAVEISRPLFSARGAQVAARLPAAVPPVRADADRLKQVLLNLLGNAAKFVPARDGCAILTLQQAGDSLIVTVADNGPGVPEADRDTIFEPFRQSGAAGSRPPGTGLGLPISRRIVEQSGGRMWLEPATGRGAQFAFSLPLRPEGGNTP
ncbi:HAMP domain-containing sensor histidine kinase [Pseudoxanthobacter sp.]|uniref:sensor histidine kinase n=1 Tax=Pseudoxanthobacter sp. TaxID=1925742 RepID=UPI002FE2023D